MVYAKPAFGDPARVLRYLGRYTHRVAISNQRLLSFDGRSRKLPMERLCARQQAAHHDAHRERVPAPILPTCAAQRLRSHPPLRLSRQRTPDRSHRARSPAACLPASKKFATHQLPVSCVALPTMRSQHEHRAQPHCATTGFSMQTSRHFLIPASSRGSRRCGPHVSGHLCLHCEVATLVSHCCLQAIHEIARSWEIYLPSRLTQPGSSRLFAFSMQANSAPSSIAAPATATAFLLVSLSKMPRGSSGAGRAGCEDSPRGISDQG